VLTKTINGVLAKQMVAGFNPNRTMTEKICVSIQGILNTNAIVTLFPDGQFSASFDFDNGVPVKAHRVFGSSVISKINQQ
jgi:hypothetical protein